jgi:small GTP-binding protein
MDSEKDMGRLRSRAVSHSSPTNKDKTTYRVLVMGGGKVGKTAIIKRIILHQFLQTTKETLQEMYQWHFKSHRENISFNIEDTGDSFAYDFPSMFELSLSSAHIVCLVYAVNDRDTFEHVATLRDHILRLRPDLQIVVVGNKIDLDRKDEDRSIAELVVECDWENGYVECSAKLNIDMEKVFFQIVKQLNINFDQSKDVKINVPFSAKVSKLIGRRRSPFRAFCECTSKWKR